MTWSAVRGNDGYASDIEEFDTKDEAIEYINNQDDDWKLVQGTQLWNEPIGQIKEDISFQTHVVYFRKTRC